MSGKMRNSQLTVYNQVLVNSLEYTMEPDNIYRATAVQRQW